MAANGVDFVDENDARGVLLALLKQVAHAACADADKHLHKVRSGDGEERNVGFAGDGAGQQSFAGSGRTDQKYAFRNAATEFLELLRLTQKLDDFLQFFLGFFDACDVFERDLLLLGGMQPSPALAKAERLVAAALHLPHHKNPKSEQENKRNRLHQNRDPATAVLLLIFDIYAFGKHGVVQRLVSRGNHRLQFIVGVLVNAVQIVAGDAHRLDLALLDVIHQ